MNLIKCGVVFDPEAHTYTLNGRQLRGITPVLHHYICPDKYKDVPDAVLAKAAAKGHEIHSAIEALVEGFTPSKPTPEQAAFMECAASLGRLATEYLVTDNKNFASAIDLVGENSDGVILGDIKTTAVFDKEYLRWQLSIYACLYEAQTGDKVAKLYGVHLREGKGQCVEIERIDDAIVRSLLAAAASGEEWENPLASTWEPAAAKLAKLAKLERKIQELNAKVEELKKERDPLASEFLADMQANNCTKVVKGDMSIAVKAGYTSQRLDATKLKTDLPDIYSKYTYSSAVKASLTVKFAKN